jgi:hypothetical protein
MVVWGNIEKLKKEICKHWKADRILRRKRQPRNSWESGDKDQGEDLLDSCRSKTEPKRPESSNRFSSSFNCSN